MRGKTGIIAKFHRTDLVVCTCSHFREGKTLSYSQRNMVLSHNIVTKCETE